MHKRWWCKNDVKVTKNCETYNNYGRKHKNTDYEFSTKYLYVQTPIHIYSKYIGRIMCTL